MTEQRPNVANKRMRGGVVKDAVIAVTSLQLQVRIGFLFGFRTGNLMNFYQPVNFVRYTGKFLGIFS